MSIASVPRVPTARFGPDREPSGRGFISTRGARARRKEVAMKWMLIAVLCLSSAGCGLAAAPCRVASAGLKIVPVVGHVAAAPTDACADVIDP
nr:MULTISPECIES: DUF6726 family protein [Burkholderia]